MARSCWQAYSGADVLLRDSAVTGKVIAVAREAFIGLGSNLGDRLLSISKALKAIDALDDTRVVAVSQAVETEPWGVADQPLFANAVARVTTSIPADRLLGALKEIESALGRCPDIRYGPRVIDLDILLYGDDEWEAPDLVIPHPRLTEREFVVVPLLSIAPDVTLPDGMPIAREEATEGHVLDILGPVPGFEDVTPPSGGWSESSADATPVGWTEVASALFAAGPGSAFAVGLLFDAGVLEQEGIPVGWNPMPPQEEYNPWALPRMYRLLVPDAEAGRAREVLAEVHTRGVPQEPDWLGKS